MPFMGIFEDGRAVRRPIPTLIRWYRSIDGYSVFPSCSVQGEFDHITRRCAVLKDVAATIAATSKLHKISNRFQQMPTLPTSITDRSLNRPVPPQRLCRPFLSSPRLCNCRHKRPASRRDRLALLGYKLGMCIR
jgi:hypothetical protein